MKYRNSVGPRIKHWGTPSVRVKGSRGDLEAKYHLHHICVKLSVLAEASSRVTTKRLLNVSDNEENTPLSNICW